MKNPNMRLDLSSIDAINNLDTARMALRWSLERLRALETLQAEAVDRAEREAGLRKSLEKTHQESRLAEAKKARDHDVTVRALREQLQAVIDSRIEMERSAQGKFKTFELTQTQARAALEERSRNLEAAYAANKAELEKSARERMAAFQLEWENERKRLEQSHAQECQRLLQQAAERETVLGALQDQLQATRDNRVQAELVFQEKLRTFEQAQAQAQAALEERSRNLEAHFSASKAQLEKSHHEKVKALEADRDKLVQSSARAQADLEAFQVKLAEEFQQTLKTREIADETRRAAMERSAAADREKFAETISRLEEQSRQLGAELQNVREEKEREKEALLREMNDWRQRAQSHLPHTLELEKRLARAEEMAQVAQNTLQRQTLQIEEQTRAWERQKSALEAKLSHEREVLEKASQAKLAAMQSEQQKRFEAQEHAHSQERQGLMSKLGERESALGALQEQLQSAWDKGLELDLAYQEKLKAFERAKAEARAALAEREKALEAEFSANKAELEQSYREKAAQGLSEWEAKVKNLQAAWEDERHRLLAELQKVHGEEGSRRAALEAQFIHNKELLERASQEKIAAARAEQEKRIQALDHARAEERRGLLHELEARETAIAELREQLQAARTQRIQSEQVFQEKIKTLEQSSGLARASAEARERALEADYAAGRTNLEQSYREQAALDKAQWEEKIKSLQENWGNERQRLLDEIQNIRGEVKIHKADLDAEYARSRQLLEKENEGKLAAIQAEQDKRFAELEHVHAQERQALLKDMEETEAAKVLLHEQLQAIKTQRAQAEMFFLEKIKSVEQDQVHAQAFAEARERAVEAAHARDIEHLEKTSQDKLAALRLEQEKRLQALNQAHAQERQGLVHKLGERETALGALQEQLQRARDKGLDLDIAYQEKLKAFEQAKADARAALEERVRTLEAENAASKAQFENAYREKAALDASEWDRKIKMLQEDSSIERQRLLGELQSLREKMQAQAAAQQAEHAREKQVLEKVGQEKLAVLRSEQEKRLQALEQARSEERQGLLNEMKARESDADVLRVQLQAARDQRAQSEAAFNKRLKAFEQEQLQTRAALAERERALEAEFAASKAQLEKSSREKAALYESEWEMKYKALLNKLNERESALGTLQEQLQVARDKGLELELAYQEKLKIFEHAKAEARAAWEEKERSLEAKFSASKAELEKSYMMRMAAGDAMEKAGQEKLAALRAELENRLRTLDRAHAQEREGFLKKLSERESELGALRSQLEAAQDKGLELERAYQEKLEAFERTKAEARAALEKREKALDEDYAASKAELEKSYRVKLAAGEVLGNSGQEKLAALRVEQEKRLLSLEQAHGQERQALLNELAQRDSALAELRDQVLATKTAQAQAERSFQEKLKTFEKAQALARASLEERERALEPEFAASRAELEKSYRQKTSAFEAEFEQKRKAIEENWRTEQKKMQGDVARLKKEVEQARAEVEDTREAMEREKAALLKERNDWREKSQLQFDRILALEKRAAQADENEQALARRKEELQALRGTIAADFQKKQLELEHLKQKKEQEILKIIEQYKANG